MCTYTFIDQNMVNTNKIKPFIHVFRQRQDKTACLNGGGIHVHNKLGVF